MKRHGVREVPDDGAGLGVTKGRALVFDRHTLDAARQVGFPVGFGAGNGINAGPLFGRQVAIPAQVHQHLHGEFRVSVLDLGVFRVNAVRQQVFAVAFNAKAGTEGKATFGHRQRHVIEHVCARMVHFRCAPGWPWQAVDITIAGATHRTQCGLVEVV